MKLLYILLTSLLLQIDFPIYRPDSAYIAQEPYKVQSQTYNGPNKGVATDHDAWVVCNDCHELVIDHNGYLYNWDKSTGTRTDKHEHQNGWTTDQHIDEDQKGVMILIVIALLWCAITTFSDPKPKDKLHNNRDSKYDDC